MPRKTTRSIVLIGGGHAHIQLLKEWKKSPFPNTDLLLISDERNAIYSGMVPGYMAGLYDQQDISFNLNDICQKAGVNFLQDRLEKLDPVQKKLTLTSGKVQAYDILSLNMGSTVQPLPYMEEDLLIPTRPISGLLHKIDAIFQKEKADIENECAHLTIIGGGAAGYEIAASLSERLKKELPGELGKVNITLIAGERGLFAGQSGGLRKRAEKVLFKKGVLLINDRVVGIHSHMIQLKSGLNLPASKIIWAAGATPHPEFNDFNLKQSKKGFISVTPTLQTPQYPNIFVVGDAVGWQKKELPKAGVYAVRMGPVLMKNIRKMARKGVTASLTKYKPQAGFLRLLHNGDDTAIGHYHGLSFEGKFVQKWKDKVDRRFMESFQIDRSN